MNRRSCWIPALAAGLVFAFASSCSIVEKGTEVLGQSGKINSKDSQTILRTSQALRQSFSDITEEEEYYIGRSVAALILSRYPVYNNPALTTYVNTVGNAVAVYCDRPQTYAGYHFLILDTDEVNALAAPSGFVFITKGLLKRCRNEEMLASILAHEIGHVVGKHGLQSIKKSRLVDTFKLIGQEAVDRYGPERLSQLTDIFQNVLGDIAEKLIERGYDRKYEYEADQMAVRYAVTTGYDANGLADFLKTMVGDTGGEAALGWFKTHPSAEDRLGRVEKGIASLAQVPVKQTVRETRFLSAVKSLR